MVVYDEEYYLTHDIDYFLAFHGRLLHVASNGSIPPKMIEGIKNREVQLSIYSALNTGQFAEHEVDVNRDVIRMILEREGYDIVYDKDIDNYAESFVEFAKMGFYSYDTIDNNLIPICKPIDSREERENIVQNPIPSADDFFDMKSVDGYIVLSPKQ